MKLTLLATLLLASMQAATITITVTKDDGKTVDSTSTITIPSNASIPALLKLRSFGPSVGPNAKTQPTTAALALKAILLPVVKRQLDNATPSAAVVAAEQALTVARQAQDSKIQ